LPAFLVPFSFTLGGRGMGVLLQAPPGDVAWTALASAAGVAALAAALGGWALSGARPALRVLAAIGGLSLLHPSAAGTALGGAAVTLAWALHRLDVARARRIAPPTADPGSAASPGGAGPSAGAAP
jgi:TRAP-type uncharacterized transport system fused permease subunit